MEKAQHRAKVNVGVGRSGVLWERAFRCVATAGVFQTPMCSFVSGVPPGKECKRHCPLGKGVVPGLCAPRAGIPRDKESGLYCGFDGGEGKKRHVGVLTFTFRRIRDTWQLFL
jgi:hypothetical protein